tara:strand:+ start:204 stop:404 length:201 start_codon:yes stop_codon:yes gene_type:complete
MAENPWKYNKQDPHKSYSQNSEQGNGQCLFIHESRDPSLIISQCNNFRKILTGLTLESISKKLELL